VYLRASIFLGGQRSGRVGSCRLSGPLNAGSWEPRCGGIFANGTRSICSRERVENVVSCLLPPVPGRAVDTVHHNRPAWTVGDALGLHRLATLRAIRQRAIELQRLIRFWFSRWMTVPPRWRCSSISAGSNQTGSASVRETLRWPFVWFGTAS
jgi:hypothetical protein